MRSARDGACAIELNANGYNKPCAEPYPAWRCLQQAHAEALSITLASDAHRPELVGQRFDDLAAYAQQAGYQSFVSFEGRRAS